MGTARNGARQRPPLGERGASSATSEVTSLFSYGDRRLATVKELHDMMSFDPWAEAIEGALTWPIRSAPWSIQETDGDRGEAAFVRERFGKLAIRAIAGSLTAVGRRVAHAEQVWDLDGEDVILADLAFREADQCVVERDRNNRPIGFRQRAYAGLVSGRGFVNEPFLFADRKAYVFFHDAATRPGAGRSALEGAYQHHLDKKKLYFYRYKLLEKYGGPSTVGKRGTGGGEDERRAFEKAVADARSGASVVIDADDDIGYLDPPNAGEAFGATIRDLNFEMAVASFVQFLALAQEGNSGAYALSRDHSDFLTIVTEGRMAELADALTTGPIRDLVFWNFGPDASFPAFEFEPLSEHVSKKMAEAAGRLFAKTGRPMPRWISEGIVDGYAASLGVEKPEDADEIGEPVKDRTSEGGDEG